MVRGAYGMVYYPGSGGIGSAPSDLGGGGYLTSTGVNLGTYPASPNTPPPGASLRNPFTSGYFEPPATQVGASVSTAFRDLVTSYGHMWNVSVQQRLPWKLVAEAAYVGTRGLNLWTNLSRNAIPSDMLAQGAALDALVPNPFFGVIKTGDSLLTQSTTRASQLMKPFPHYSGVTRFRDSMGDSWYNGFTARLDRNSANLGFGVSYTLSRQEDTVPERFGARGSVIIDPNDLSKSRAVAEDDRTHVLTGHFIYQLPFGKGRRWANSGWVADVIGQWQVSGIGSFATGRPLIITGISSSNGVSTGLGAYAKLLGTEEAARGAADARPVVQQREGPGEGRGVRAARPLHVRHRHAHLPRGAGPEGSEAGL